MTKSGKLQKRLKLVLTNNKIQGLTVSIMIRMQIRRLNWHYEDPQKSPPTYSYLAPKLAVLFVVIEYFV